MLYDTPTRFGWISIALHWLGAGAIVTLFLLGEATEEAEGEAYLDAVTTHAMVGVVLLPLLAFRIYWRIRHRKPKHLTPHKVYDRLADIVTVLILLAMAVAIVTGPLTQWSDGRSLPLLGLASIPSPFPPSEAFHAVVSRMHGIATHLFIPLVALHLLGVVKHLAFDGDDTFARMLGPGKELTIKGENTEQS